MFIAIIDRTETDRRIGTRGTSTSITSRRQLTSKPRRFASTKRDLYVLRSTSRSSSVSRRSRCAVIPSSFAPRRRTSFAQTIISLDALSASVESDALSMLRFDTTVDWHERHRFLKFEAPIDIRAETATYETQYGVINRPTHRNTTWDRAKFEVCGHVRAPLFFQVSTADDEHSALPISAR